MLETTNARSGPYVASGSDTDFPFYFPVLSHLHLAVYKDGERQAVNQYGTTHTTNGGSVRFHTPPAAGSLVAIVRDVPIIQDVDLQNNTAFLPEVIEMAMDRLTMICQQMQEILSRTLTAPPTKDLDQALLFERFMSIPDESAAASSAAAAAASSAAAAEEDRGATLTYKTEAFQYYQKCVAFYNLADAAALAATTAKTAAEQAKQVAQGASTNAAQSAITAAQCESGALASKNAAATSEQNAATSEQNAATSEQNAATSAQNIAALAPSVAAAATAAATSEQNAATSEQNAETASAAAATAKTAAEQAKQLAQDASTNAAQSAISAAQRESSALASKNAAAISEQNAATSEQNAATSEQNAATSAAAAANVSGITEHNADMSAHPSLHRPLAIRGGHAIGPGKLTVPHFLDLSTSLSYARAEVRLLCLAADRGYSPGDIVTQAMTYRQVIDPGPPVEIRTFPVPITVRLDYYDAIVDLGVAVPDGEFAPTPIFAPDNIDPSILAPLKSTSWMLYIHIWL